MDVSNELLIQLRSPVSQEIHIIGQFWSPLANWANCAADFDAIANSFCLHW